MDGGCGHASGQHRRDDDAGLAAAFGLEPGQAIVETPPPRVARPGWRVLLPVALVATGVLIWAAIPGPHQPTTPAASPAQQPGSPPAKAPTKTAASMAVRIAPAPPAAGAMQAAPGDAAPLLAIILFRAGSPPARSRAGDLARLLQADPAVAGLQVVGVADPGPRGIYYMFAEDYPAAKTLTARLGQEYGAPRQIAAGQNPLPGTVVVALP